MDKYDIIFFCLLILASISGIIEALFAYGDGSGTISFGYVIVFPLIMVIYTIYIKYIKKVGHYSIMFGVIGNTILTFAIWALSGALIYSVLKYILI